MIYHRERLAREGLVEDATAMDTMMWASAAEDKTKWVIRGLEIKFWEPIK